MKYIQLNVKPAATVHGYDADNNTIIEEHEEGSYAPKIIAIDRIQSLTEQYLLVNGSHGRVMYWEYTEAMEEVAERLRSWDLLVE